MESQAVHSFSLPPRLREQSMRATQPGGHYMLRGPESDGQTVRTFVSYHRHSGRRSTARCAAYAPNMRKPSASPISKAVLVSERERGAAHRRRHDRCASRSFLLQNGKTRLLNITLFLSMNPRSGCYSFKKSTNPKYEISGLPVFAQGSRPPLGG